MLKKERQNNILEMIRSIKYCTIKLLSEQLFVAPITIRRDLTEMESAGLVTRCYGGATIPHHENREVPFVVRNKSNFAIKANLAKKHQSLYATEMWFFWMLLRPQATLQIIFLRSRI